ncbi:MAG: hypothetical protein JXB06_12725 [Spirochaetales bacterium]|nr:hypothetical protein [Spirochaetales bacterium]
MDPAQGRAAAFINHLLSNPALNNLNPLQKEEQILQFLEANARSLVPTLASPRFFPGRPWNQIWRLLYSALTRETDRTLKPQLEELIRRKISFAFASQIQPNRFPEDQCRREMWEFTGRLLQKAEARKALAGPLTAIEADFTRRYLEKSFEDRQYVHFELTKVQRLRLEIGDIEHMIHATLLLRPAVQLLTVARRAGREAVESVLVQPQFAATAFASMKAQLKNIPQALLRGALFSNVSFEEDKQIDATARIAAIFSCRARNYKPIERVDRGASTPDRSWFSITRRNYRYYGFDIKMLDEFYKIAAESGW